MKYDLTVQTYDARGGLRRGDRLTANKADYCLVGKSTTRWYLRDSFLVLGLLVSSASALMVVTVWGNLSADFYRHAALLIHTLGLLAIVLGIPFTHRRTLRHVLVFAAYAYVNLILDVARVTEKSPTRLALDYQVLVVSALQILSWFILIMSSTALESIITQDPSARAGKLPSRRTVWGQGIATFACLAALSGLTFYGQSVQIGSLIPIGYGVQGLVVITVIMSALRHTWTGIAAMSMVLCGAIMKLGADYTEFWLLRQVTSPDSGLAAILHPGFLRVQNQLILSADLILLEIIIVAVVIGIRRVAEQQQSLNQELERKQWAEIDALVDPRLESAFLTNKDNRIVWVSSALESLTGISRSVWAESKVFSLLRLGMPLHYYGLEKADDWDSVRFVTFRRGLVSDRQFLLFFKEFVTTTEPLGYLWIIEEPPDGGATLHADYFQAFRSRLKCAATAGLRQGSFRQAAQLRLGLETLVRDPTVTSAALFEHTGPQIKLKFHSSIPRGIRQMLNRLLESRNGAEADDPAAWIKQYCANWLRRLFGGTWVVVPFHDNRYIFLVGFSKDLPLSCQELKEGLEEYVKILDLVINVIEVPEAIVTGLSLLEQVFTDTVDLEAIMLQEMWLTKFLTRCKTKFQCGSAWLFLLDQNNQLQPVASSETVTVQEPVGRWVSVLNDVSGGSGYVKVLRSAEVSAPRQPEIEHALLTFDYSATQIGVLVLNEPARLATSAHAETVLTCLSGQLNLTFSQVVMLTRLRSLEAKRRSLRLENSMIQQQAVTVLNNISEVSDRLASRYRQT